MPLVLLEQIKYSENFLVLLGEGHQEMRERGVLGLGLSICRGNFPFPAKITSTSLTQLKLQLPPPEYRNSFRHHMMRVN
jgi:hypothetical protein